ncbi:MAG: hypothetical protein ACREQW_19545 [Candidatus Binatia bacterium]
MKRVTRPAAAIGSAFVFGFLCHFLYQRWSEPQVAPADRFPETRSYAVTYVPSAEPTPQPIELPLIRAGDLRKLRQLAGTEVRVRGRIYRVGHSSRSNTYFLNFGPARSAFTGVIFSSAAEVFARRRINPLNYEGREVEISGEIKDDPRYGLEMILEDPANIRILN